MGRYSFDRTSEERNAAILTARGKPFTPFWLPEQRLAPDKVDYVRTMGRKVLANVVNYLHFSDRSLLVHVQNADYSGDCLVAAEPEPCLDGDITCRWAQCPFPKDSAAFIRNLVIDDGKSMIIVPLEQPTSDNNTLTARLPEISYVLSRRKAKRYPCTGVSAALELKGRRLEGELRDFSSSGFCVQLKAGSTFRQPYFRTGDVVNTQLKRDGKVFFSGSCSVRRTQKHIGIWEIVLQPSSTAVPVFPKRTVRNPRVQLKPSPTISFEHPLSQTRLQIEVLDICSSGFSVCEDRKECIIFPGMLFPDLTVKYAGSMVMHCHAQVVYRNEDGQGKVICGIAILDTEMVGYTRLNRLAESALDSCAQVSGEIDPEALWEFLFSSGFIYPKKYHLLSSSKEAFKENCKRIFQNDSEAVQHFTYEHSGRIYGYHSIVRAYLNSWLIHHHAGRSLGNRMGGLMVLRQTMHYLNDMHRLKSSKMEYAMTYFRPENRFPRLVFGHFSSALKNRKQCSMDLFSYVSIPVKLVDVALPSGWHLDGFADSDAGTLDAFYEEHSGGLLLEAMSLASKSGYDELEAVYSRHGLLRKMKVYSLKNEGDLVAVLVADYSSRGLNFSELLNCLKVIVIREEDLSWEILHKAISQLSGGYHMREVPVMCFPSQFLQEKQVTCEKAYNLWILSVDSGDAFMEYMHKRLRIC